MNPIYLFVLLFIGLIDGVSAGIVYPIIPGLLYNPTFGFLPFIHDATLKTFFYALVYITFSLSYLIGMPTIGKLSTRISKKTLTMACCGFLLIGHALSIVSIYENSYLLFLVSRSVVGFFSCNIILIQGTIGEVVNNSAKKSAYLSWVSLFFLGGFVLGPAIVSIVFHHAAIGLSSYSLLFLILIIALVFVISLLALSSGSSLLKADEKEHELIFLHTNAVFKKIAWIYFLANIMWGGLVQLTPLILTHYLHYNELNISRFYIAIALICALGVMVRIMFFAKMKLLKLVNLQIRMLIIIFMLAILLPVKQAIMFCSFAVPFIFISLNANLLTLMSGCVSKSKQGELMGQKGYISSVAWLISSGVFSFIAIKSLFLYFAILLLNAILCFVTIRNANASLAQLL